MLLKSTVSKGLRVLKIFFENYWKNIKSVFPTFTQCIPSQSLIYYLFVKIYKFSMAKQVAAVETVI